MINVSINFKIQDGIYKQYESILQEFLNYLNDLNVVDIEVIEKLKQNERGKNYESKRINRTIK